ncbi:porin [Candidatus Mycalebacterium sp.]
MKFSKYFAAAVLAAVALAMPAQSFAQSMIDGKFGYEEDLYYESRDGGFKIKQNILIQFRGEAVTDNTPGDSDISTDFMVRRLRLKYGGHAYKEWIKWGLQLAGSAGRTNKTPEINMAGVVLSDETEEIKIGEAFIVLVKSTAADLKVGRYKVPYGREALNSSSALQFVDRSFIRNFVIGTNRADGVSVGGVLGNIIAYRGGLFQEDDEIFQDMDNMLFAGRVQINLCCGKLEHSSGSFTAGGDYKTLPNFAKVPTFAIGAGGFYDTDTDVVQQRVGEATEVVSVTRDNGKEGFTVDLIAKIERANLEAAYYYGSAKDKDNNYRTLSHTAYRVQGGFMLTPGFEVATRCAYADYDSDASVSDEWQCTGGLNWYIAKHRAKVQLDYTYGNEKNGISPTKDKETTTYRGQVQIYF